jgi:hypothetical protein
MRRDTQWGRLVRGPGTSLAGGGRITGTQMPGGGVGGVGGVGGGVGARWPLIPDVTSGTGPH